MRATWCSPLLSMIPTPSTLIAYNHYCTMQSFSPGADPSDRRSARSGRTGGFVGLLGVRGPAQPPVLFADLPGGLGERRQRIGHHGLPQVGRRGDEPHEFLAPAPDDLLDE